MSAIAPAKLTGSKLILPIAMTGPLTTIPKTGFRAVKTESTCEVTYLGVPLIHHRGGILFRGPHGWRHPVDLPAIHGDLMLFRDRRGRDPVRHPGLSKAETGLVLAVKEGIDAEYTSRVRMIGDSWVGLASEFPPPPISSGLFTSLKVSMRPAAGFC
jgi:hypothetical protein